MRTSNLGNFKFIATLVLILSSSALASGSGKGDPAPGTIGGGGGGEIPSPFSTFNQKAELADGELYVLFGSVMFGPPLAGSTRKQAYLHVDMSVHPWLSNQKRRAYPFYPIAGPAKFWEKYEDQRIRLICEAQVRISVPARGKPDVEIILIPQFDIPDPLIVRP